MQALWLTFGLMSAAISSHPSTDSLDSLVLHDSGSPGNTAGKGSNNPDMEQELIAAAEALLNGQVHLNHALVPVTRMVKAAA